jgi:hypothetical protein
MRSEPLRAAPSCSDALPHAPPARHARPAEHLKKEKISEEKEKEISSSTLKRELINITEGVPHTPEPNPALRPGERCASRVLGDLIRLALQRDGLRIPANNANLLVVESRLNHGATADEMIHVWRHVLATWSDPTFISVSSVFGAKYPKRARLAEGWQPPATETTDLWEPPPGPENPLTREELVDSLEDLRAKLNWESLPTNGASRGIQSVGDLLREKVAENGN